MRWVQCHCCFSSSLSVSVLELVCVKGCSATGGKAGAAHAAVDRRPPWPPSADALIDQVLPQRLAGVAVAQPATALQLRGNEVGEVLEAAGRVRRRQHEPVGSTLVHEELETVDDVGRGADEDRHPHALRVVQGTL